MTPIRIGMLHHGIKLITQNNFVLIYCDPLSKVASGPEPCQENVTCYQIIRICYVPLLIYCPIICHLLLKLLYV